MIPGLGRLLRANYLQVPAGVGTTSTNNAPLEVPCGGAWCFLYVPVFITNDDGPLSVKPQATSLIFTQAPGWDGWHQGVFLTEGNYDVTYTAGAVPPGTPSTIRWALFAPTECDHG